MKKLLFHWVPHELTLNHKQKRVDICKILLDTLNTLTCNQLKKIVTCDESWFYLSYKADSILSTDENTKITIIFEYKFYSLEIVPSNIK